MGKSEESNSTTIEANDTNFLTKSPTDASKMLEAALLQMDGIISGACAEGAGERSTEWKGSIKEITRNLVTMIKTAPIPPPPPDPTTVNILLEWMQPACLLGYARVVALQSSMPNICAATANVLPHMMNFSPPFQAPCGSASNDLSRHTSKEFLPVQYAPFNSHVCHVSQASGLIGQKDNNLRMANKIAGATSLLVQSGRCAGSLDRRRRRLKNKAERDQRAKSQSDLICCDKDKPAHYCSLQQFQCDSHKSYEQTNYQSKTEERLQKLENERGALHMEISVLSDQVEAQSSKILELEGLLQEKKTSLRQMEEALQKEVLSRSALETQKLELLSSLSEMKLRQASLEHENLSLRTANPLTNGERFSRHTGQYSSLPRPPAASSRKGVAFAEEERTVIDEPSYRMEGVPEKSLSELSMGEISDWLARIGLECYAPELRRWGATGSKLMDATHNQIEKELDIKNSLHRKKLLYAIESERSNGEGFLGSDKMDNAAVLRWLDDIGLPQHKEAFHNAKVDGRVLHRLTTEDLLSLGVTAQLHATSLRRGIQVLRELNFEYDNLERRSMNGNGADGSNVALWTIHRVMEWLRVVDLAEYAPNMRGSGVHGGLMVYEGRFTSELLATLLSIPPAKTLLRRHLTTHFNQILGREVVHHKRDMESTIGFVPLTLTARLKIPKKSQFTLKRKKSKNEVDYGNLVCPLDASPPDLEVMEQKKVIGCI